MGTSPEIYKIKYVFKQILKLKFKEIATPKIPNSVNITLSDLRNFFDKLHNTVVDCKTCKNMIWSFNTESHCKLAHAETKATQEDKKHMQDLASLARGAEAKLAQKSAAQGTFAQARKRKLSNSTKPKKKRPKKNAEGDAVPPE